MNKRFALGNRTKLWRGTAVLIVLLAAALAAQGQKPHVGSASPRCQYGAAVKGLVDIVDRKLHFSLAVGAGAGYLVLPNAAFLSAHLDVVIYNNGLGSPKPGLQKPALETDVIGALTLTGGGPYRFSNKRFDADSYIPLYYFSNLNRHSLQNPFLYSASLGSDFVFSSTRKIRIQRIGFLNVNLHGFDLSYYNDGTPFDKNLGDGHDRYYTGGGIVSYHASMKHTVNVFEVAYFKFTGYHKNAFEIANALDQSYINYHDQDQQKYNKSLFSLGIGSSNGHWMAGLNIYNDTKTDYQHKIHNLIFNGYHRVPYDRSITPFFSGSTYTTKIALK